MATFTYSARTGTNTLIIGDLEATSAQDVLQQLRRRGLSLVACTQVETSVWKTDLFPKRVSAKDRVIFTRQFATLIGSGMPLVQALAALSEESDSPELVRILRRISGDIENGETLASAMRQHPKTFDRLYTSMVEAGEAGGMLDSILLRLAAFQESADATRRKVKGASIYPLSVLAIAAVCVTILLLKVVPVFQEMFAAANVPLPGPTKAVIAAADLLVHQGWMVAIGLGLVGVGARAWARTPVGRLLLDRLILKLPLFGTLQRRAAVARFTRTLGTLMQSGVPILDGLDITAKTAGNVVIEGAIREARTAIAAGQSIARPLRASGQFPTMVCAMIAVGEQTGNLDDMLIKVADFYDAEVASAVDMLLKAMEPLMIVVLGGVIGSLVIALYAPILGMAQAAQG